MSDNHTPTYSQIMDADKYNLMMSKQHLYITEADDEIIRIARDHAEQRKTLTEILEIGPGPIRLTPRLCLISNAYVTAVDYDPGWMKEAMQIVADKNLPINLVCEDIEQYQHHGLIDIAVSQGCHHHIQKGEHTAKYLANVRGQLSPGGIFIISDEMIPNYGSEEERYIRLCIWYSHIIHSAMCSRYDELAQAEIETLLDDLFEGSGQRAIKSDEQISLVRDSVTFISNSMKYGFFKQAESLSEDLVRKIWDTQTGQSVEEAPLSRGDYKISFAEFEKEVSTAGFRIRESTTIGPIETIGGFGIYTLAVPS